MIAINQRSPTAIKVGTINVLRVMVGLTQVWPAIEEDNENYLSVSPSSVLLNDENNNTSTIQVDTNTSWRVE
jgi:hypothetical protein